MTDEIDPDNKDKARVFAEDDDYLYCSNGPTDEMNAILNEDPKTTGYKVIIVGTKDKKNASYFFLNKDMDIMYQTRHAELMLTYVENFKKEINQ